jgi:hypothetical protein
MHCPTIKGQAECVAPCKWYTKTPSKPFTPPVTPPADSTCATPPADIVKPAVMCSDGTNMYWDTTACKYACPGDVTPPTQPPADKMICAGKDAASEPFCRPLVDKATCYGAGTGPNGENCEWRLSNSTPSTPPIQPAGLCKSKLPATAAVSTTTDDKCYKYLTPASCGTVSTCEWEDNTTAPPKNCDST